MTVTQINFKPSDWYWTNTDGRIFSSKRNQIVYTYDSGYQSFLASQGGNPTPWPTDITGKQTAAALQQVLDYYGVTATVPGP